MASTLRAAVRSGGPATIQCDKLRHPSGRGGTSLLTPCVPGSVDYCGPPNVTKEKLVVLLQCGAAQPTAGAEGVFPIENVQVRVAHTTDP